MLHDFNSSGFVNATLSVCSSWTPVVDDDSGIAVFEWDLMLEDGDEDVKATILPDRTSLDRFTSVGLGTGLANPSLTRTKGSSTKLADSSALLHAGNSPPRGFLALVDAALESSASGLSNAVSTSIWELHSDDWSVCKSELNLENVVVV